VKPEIDFNVMHEGQTLNGVMKSVIELSDRAFVDLSPDAVLVQGDTTTAMSVAIAAFYRRIRIGHIEAGLRTGNLNSPYPEEGNRKIISQIANWNFAPTQKASENLLKEGARAEDVFVVGNSVIDALLLASRISKENGITKKGLVKKIGFNPKDRKFILVTCHRRENFGEPVRQILESLLLLAREHEDFHFVFPAHPNPEIQNAVRETLVPRPQNFLVLPPFNYLEMIYMMEHCFLVLTDSGGMQEEVPSFKKPILILRDTTERPEVLDHNLAKLVGASKERITNEVNAFIKDSAYYESFIGNPNPFGDGKTSKRIADILRREIVS
jgi:UDP-N-acetylglucosamine 2-epimerase